ncbi:hypothetical protein [Nitrosomonas sp.]|uniref:hypothetical protein n=1 Tax=Nitrosomonas sp. TaxID=42353 RepID=UPI0025DBD14F|nr:hypothetical protein [Nitrosomonas sp.]
MTKRTVHQEYLKKQTAEVAVFAAELRDHGTNKEGTFDSAAANDFMATAINQNIGVKVPENLQIVLDEAPSGEEGDDVRSKITKAILDGIDIYEAQHGCNAPADVIELGLHLAYSTSDAAKRKYRFDSANSDHQDNLALQPNRAVLAILSTMGDAIPFAHYLPADIGSNKGVLAIMAHQAGNTYGQYTEGGSMDGANSGNSFISASRVNVSMPAVSTGNVTGALTAVQATDETCDPAASTLKLLRGRTLVYVNGMVAAKEVDQSGSGNSAVSGTINVGGTDYAIGGTINTDTGVYALTTTPALGTTVPVAVEGFIDYERAPEFTPSIIAAATTYELFAAPWRAITQITIDSATQMSNELGLDPYGESILTIQNQFANERHYQILLKARRLAKNNSVDYDFDWPNQKSQKTRAQIWLDFATPLGAVSQQMAVDTMDHGITHMYVGKYIASAWMSLPREIFEPSGIAERPGIFRIGRLFGRIDVYYTPKGLTDTAAAGQILCIGKATNVALNPFVLGDATAPIVQPLAVNADMKRGAAFYARNFTAVNPYKQASLGCAIINVTNMI